MPKRGAAGWTRYQPLVDYLAASDKTEIVLTLAQVETILGAPLVDTAYVNASVWVGRHHAYVRQWQALGWSAQLDRRNHCVIFARDVPP